MSMHSGRNNDGSVLSITLSIAKASVTELSTTFSEESCKHLIKKVRADFREIRKIHGEFYERTKTETVPEIPAVFEWLCDNFYIIEREYYACIKALARAPRILCKDKLPRIFIAAHSFLELSDTPLDELSCSVLLSVLEEEHGLALSEYFTSSALLRAALICRGCEIIQKYVKGTTMEKPGREEKYARLLGNVITSLRYVAYHDFDADAENSKPAKILALDPAKEYSFMTSSTRKEYLHLLCRNAKKLGIGETEYANMLLRASENASGNRRHIGYPLYEHPAVFKYAYFTLLIGTPLIITLLLSLISPLCVFAFFPVWEATRLCVDFIFSLFVKSIPLPRKDISEILDDSPVLVVITSLLTGEKNDGGLFDRLERLYRSNGGKNIYFGILGDLPDSKSAKGAGDEKILEHAYGRIKALSAKYGNNFILFERRRSYSKSEESFMGWERKRGAVLELVRFLRGGNTTFSTRCASLARDILGNTKIKYVVTLDADTNLPIDAVKDMCACMLHPLARPYIDKKKGIVTDGYAIMQPRCTPELSSAAKTPFSRLFCGVGGADIYSSAAFDVYQNIFGEGIFCGKGIFDVDAFGIVIDRHCTFPEDKILSHDSLEGAKLRCALISDIEFTDSFPKNELSYLKRRHRWVRGDIQNLAYLFGKIRFDRNDIRKNTINALSRFKLFDNARIAAMPCFSFLCVFLSAFTGTAARVALLFASLSYIYLPVLLDAFSMLFSLAFQCAARRFFSKGVSSSIWQSFLRMLFTLAGLSKTAFSSFDAILRSFYRILISGKKLLEWQTAAQSDAGDGSLTMFVHKDIFSAFSGFLLFAFAPAGFLRALSLLWLAFPVISYHTSFDTEVKNASADADEQKKLRTYARDIWQFFSENVTSAENHLPPDNIQLSPLATVAHRTSPTNIGLYLLSVLSARDFGFIDTDELYSRVNDTLGTLEKLEKWHGHLYNWYDTETLAVLSPKYISVVDSGNFTACLITLREGLRDYVFESTKLLELLPRIEGLELNTDYKILYNQKRNLFVLGAEIMPGGEYTLTDGCYDLLMSEARTISYIECAKRNVPKKHWSSLSRCLVTGGGYIGLSSWTGTAFEYFMPPIFLPEKKGSLAGEALLFALGAQRSRKAPSGAHGVWGISESGYYSFDSEMNYRYKAFGIPLLSLKTGLERELVISPYSSFLSMCVDKGKAMNNLSALEKLGFYGKYGFYEAIDYTPDRSARNGSAVKSYMSHHLGMSLAALCNACFDGILQKRFMSDSAMSCARELLEEKIPVNAVIRKVTKQHDLPSRPGRKEALPGRIHTRINPCEPNVALLADAGARCIVSSSGHTEMYDGDIALNFCDFSKYECTSSLYGFVKYRDKVLSASPLPGINPQGTQYSTKVSGGYCELSAKLSGFIEISEGVTLSKGETSVFSVRLTASPRSPAPKNRHEDISFGFCFTPILAEKKSYLAHGSFSSLFIEAEYLSESKVLIYRRRPRGGNEKEQLLGVALSDINTDFEFDTRADDCFMCKHTAGEFAEIFSQEPKNSLGACIRPYCRIIFSKKALSGEVSGELLMCRSDSVEKIIAAIDEARGKSFEKKTLALAESAERLSRSTGCFFYGTEKNESAFEKLLRGILFGSASNFSEDKMPTHTGISEIWKKGISGDIPIVCALVISEALIPRLEQYFRAFKALRLCRVRFDLCIIFSETEPYRRPRENEICEIIERCDCSEYLGRKNGGIFLIDRRCDEASASALLSRSILRPDILYAGSTDKNAVVCAKPRLPITKPNLSVDFARNAAVLFSTMRGDFTENGFTVKKDREFKSPYSHILTGRQISTLVTQNSLGYTFVGNAQNRRITPFSDNALTDMSGERLYLISGKHSYDLCAMARYVTFGKGTAVYEGIADGIKYNVCVYTSEKLAVKYCDVKLDFPKGSSESRKLMYCAMPVMGRDMSENKYIEYSKKDGVLVFGNPFSEFFGTHTGFITGKSSECEDFSACRFITDSASLYLPECGDMGYSDCAAAYLTVRESDKCEYYRFVLGALRTDNFDRLLRFTLDKAFSGFSEKVGAVAFAKSLVPQFLIEAGTKLARAYAALFNFFLPYQSCAGRFIARSGFYQSGGAYGFRDQLQDSLSVMYSNPNMTRTHIYRCCARQFFEGDVLHWWHDLPQRYKSTEVGRDVCMGVRTLCSDDYLWLPFAVAEFVKYSGDRDFLKKKVRYLDGEKLSGAQYEKYIRAVKGELAESVYEHCKRALDRGISRLGIHGLPLIGSCDWCDGYSSVGTYADGESVWLAMFLCITLKAFCDIAKKLGDTEALDKYSHARLSLLSALEKHGYREDEGQFIRGYYADNSLLGSLMNDECKTDLLPQCFYAMLKTGNSERLYTTLKNAYERLFDKEYSIFRLLSPAFRDSSQNPGYIKGYVAGIRENGGQYTHAAVWGAIGLILGAEKLYKTGEYEKAAELTGYAENAVNAQNTALRVGGFLGEAAKYAYGTEPYYLAGDIYSNPDHKGRGGWTLYTGAAGWYYRLILEQIFGISFSGMCSENPCFEICSERFPVVPELLFGSKLQLLFVKGDKRCEYIIEYSENVNAKVTLDSQVVGGKIRIEQGNHRILVCFPKNTACEINKK